MRRTLSTKGIADLEALFEASNADSRTMKLLAHELRHRSTPRASKLLAAVEAVLTSPDSGDGDAAISQLTLLPGSLSPEPSRLIYEEQVFLSIPDADEEAPLGADDVDQSTTVGGEMKMEAACRTLKVGRSASWVAIENARREIVSRASPEALRGLADADSSTVKVHALKANEAARTLWFIQNPDLA